MLFSVLLESLSTSLILHARVTCSGFTCVVRRIPAVCGGSCGFLLEAIFHVLITRWTPYRGEFLTSVRYRVVTASIYSSIYFVCPCRLCTLAHMVLLAPFLLLSGCGTLRTAATYVHSWYFCRAQRLYYLTWSEPKRLALENSLSRSDRSTWLKICSIDEHIGTLQDRTWRRFSSSRTRITLRGIYCLHCSAQHVAHTGESSTVRVSVQAHAGPRVVFRRCRVPVILFWYGTIKAVTTARRVLVVEGEWWTTSLDFGSSYSLVIEFFSEYDRDRLYNFMWEQYPSCKTI